MKKVALLLLFSLPVQAQLSWQQTAGIGCLATAGALGIMYPATLQEIAVFVHEHPERVMLDLTTLGLALCTSRQDLPHLNRVVTLAHKLKRLVKELS